MIACLPWILIFPAYVLLWWPPAYRPALALLLAGLACAAWRDWLEPSALLAFALLLASAKLQRGRCPAFGHTLFVLTALALALHRLPGFHNPLIIDQAIKPDSVPLRMYLNLDKPLIAWWVLRVMAPPLIRGG
ncbi:hypothetical protein [Bordetella holmesii]|uniref:Membrane-associated protease n=2 Tax=Bordetella holmesii TaxID=35814 RepID=A0ABN0RYP0_9BORD|nr:hypothetical protein [Bordetella holmesii]AHV92444.1 putative membrane-associated protease [Bordetella holmesii ATCC 51541]AIT28376.1 putative membrane-associated protease [Bordetella holmesii 44057]EWM41165.1 putative membrane-associated protease [Bordetella holmesii 35009]EWM41509.1 putative membrane-associated protease [Bordetella holmesii 41130]EWM45055.1 putative membrane-associated protease [Bordetella holmesii 70147]